MANEVLKAVLGELHAAGVRDVTVAAGGKHRQVRFRVGRSERIFTAACTAGDSRAVSNAKADIRRLMRSLKLFIRKSGARRLQEAVRAGTKEQAPHGPNKGTSENRRTR